MEPAVPQWLRWSEQTITWSRADHPPRVDDPGQLALVVAPQVGGYTLNKVLMDGGSSINILYYDTFKRMKLQDRQLIPTETVFHGIVPGKSAKPISKIYLEFAFGTVETFCFVLANSCSFMETLTLVNEFQFGSGYIYCNPEIAWASAGKCKWSPSSM